MQYISIIIGVLTLISSQVKDGLKNRNLQLVLLGGVGYYFFTKGEKGRILNTLPDNVAGQLAVRLNDAFHPFINLSFSWLPFPPLPDGTDEEKVNAIAVEMGKLGNYTKVAAAYKSLYKRELQDDLSSEGVFDTFFAAYNAQTQSGGGGTSTSPPINTSPIFQGTFKKGDTVYTKAGWNLRSTNKPYGVVTKTTQNGGKWILWNNPYFNTIDGNAETFVVLQQAKESYILYPDYYVVSVRALYK